MNKVQTSIYIVHTLYKHVCKYIHDIHVCVHTCLELVHKMYILGTYIECTSSCLYVQRKMQKAKFAGDGFQTQHLQHNVDTP